MWSRHCFALLALPPMLVSAAAVRRQGPTGPTFAGKATWHSYNGATTACGWKGDDSQMITAINEAQFGPGSNGAPVCGKTVTISYQGKEVKAMVVDKGGEGSGGVDLSVPAFEALIGPTTEGTAQVTWWFEDFDPGVPSVSAPAESAPPSAQPSVAAPVDSGSNGAASPQVDPLVNSPGVCQKGQDRCVGNKLEKCDIRDNVTKLGQWVSIADCPVSCQIVGAVPNCN